MFPNYDLDFTPTRTRKLATCCQFTVIKQCLAIAKKTLYMRVCLATYDKREIHMACDVMWIQQMSLHVLTYTFVWTFP